MTFNFVLWEASPELFSIGSLTVRWYGLLFAMGFLIGQQILIWIYKTEGKSEKYVETLTVYMVIATILGARLGHCLFYEPEYYLTHPLDILKIWEGGLASHGAAAGILIAIYLYSKKQTDQSYLYVLDRMVITIALAGCLIRLGNLMNSEIVGKPTSFKGGFVFARNMEDLLERTYQNYLYEFDMRLNGKDSVDEAGRTITGIDLSFITAEEGNIGTQIHALVEGGIKKTIDKEYGENIVYSENPTIKIEQLEGEKAQKVTVGVWGVPRHPSQLYEAISSFLLFLFLFWVYNRKREKTPEGRIFGLFVVILFSLRFLYEYIKEPQVDFEQTMSYNMGQLLSIPLIIAGLFVLINSYRKKNELS
jgi:phosphatidylglycerol:prolipoprotein diacylglycerol transferase